MPDFRERGEPDGGEAGLFSRGNRRSHPDPTRQRREAPRRTRRAGERRGSRSAVRGPIRMGPAHGRPGRGGADRASPHRSARVRAALPGALPADPDAHLPAGRGRPRGAGHRGGDVHPRDERRAPLRRARQAVSPLAAPHREQRDQSPPATCRACAAVRERAGSIQGRNARRNVGPARRDMRDEGDARALDRPPDRAVAALLRVAGDRGDRGSAGLPPGHGEKPARTVARERQGE